MTEQEFQEELDRWIGWLNDAKAVKSAEARYNIIVLINKRINPLASQIMMMEDPDEQYFSDHGQ